VKVGAGLRKGGGGLRWRPMAVPNEFAVEEKPDGRTLVVTGPWSRGAHELVASGSISELVLNYARGFEEPNLDFLESWPVRGLEILDRRIRDLAPITRLGSTLQDLSVQATARSSIDLGSLPHLRTYAGPWEVVKASFHGPDALRNAVLLDYDEASLLPISVQPPMTRLEVKGAPMLESLDGAERFSRLGVLRVALARELLDLSAVDGLKCSLTELNFETCLGIGSLDPLASLTNLRFLGVSDCGRIGSLRPIADMSSLEVLYAWGSTRIEDGDLSPLLSLPCLREIRMRERREYEPPLPLVRERLRRG
jgi:hypothetical protein